MSNTKIEKVIAVRPSLIDSVIKTSGEVWDVTLPDSIQTPVTFCDKVSNPSQVVAKAVLELRDTPNAVLVIEPETDRLLELINLLCYANTLN